MKIIIGLLCILTTAFSLSFAETTAFTKEEMIKFVDEAAQFAKEKGKDAAIAEFQKQDGKFWKYNGELYIYAYNFDGTNLALPTKPNLKGTNLISLKDVDGVFFLKDMIEIAKKGKGEINYRFENPASKKVEKKVGYVVGMDGWMLGSGIYIK